MSLEINVCLQFLYHKKPIIAPITVVLLERQYACWVQFQFQTRGNRNEKNLTSQNFFENSRVLQKILQKREAITNGFLYFKRQTWSYSHERKWCNFCNNCKWQENTGIYNLRYFQKKRTKSNLKVKTFILN